MYQNDSYCRANSHSLDLMNSETFFVVIDICEIWKCKQVNFTCRSTGQCWPGRRERRVNIRAAIERHRASSGGISAWSRTRQFLKLDAIYSYYLHF